MEVETTTSLLQERQRISISRNYKSFKRFQKQKEKSLIDLAVVIYSISQMRAQGSVLT